MQLTDAERAQRRSARVASARADSPRGWLDRMLDASIVFSFDRSGFERHRRNFRAEDLEVDLSHRTCLVTGASSGLGEATAEGLAQRGARVLMLCRSRERGEATRERIVAATGSDRVQVLAADLSEAGSIDGVLEHLEGQRLDLLVNNAGVLLPDRRETSGGTEMTLATNVLGPARLTEGLLSSLSRARDPRVINVSSGGMYAIRLETDDPEWRERPFDGVRAYAESKRAIVVLTELWASRYTDRGVLFHSMHPGWADTPGVRRSLPRFWRRMRGRLRTARQGADTILWLALAAPERLGSGKFWFDRRAVSTHLFPWTVESVSERQWLWQFCRDGVAGGRDRKEVA